MAKGGGWEAQLKEATTTDGTAQTIMLVTPIEELKIYLKLAQLHLRNGEQWIVAVLDRPSSYYSELLRKQGISPRNIYFIDVGTNYRKGIYIDSAAQLMELKREIVSAAISFSTPNHKPTRLLFIFSSFTTLQLFNTEREIGIFMHELTLALRQVGACQIFIIAPDDPLIRYIAPAMDRRVRLG